MKHRLYLCVAAVCGFASTVHSHTADDEPPDPARPDAGIETSVQAEAQEPVAPVPVAEESVTIRAPRSRAKTASTTVVTAREIAAVPKRTAEDILRLVPGLTLVQHGSEGKGYQFFLRGFDAVHGSDLEITLDGIPLNEWSNVHGQGYLDLGFIIPEAVQSVDVTKGPYTLEQGAFAMAGSAEYHLGIPESTRGTRTSYTTSTTRRHRVMFTHSPLDGDGKQLLAAEALRDQGFGQNRAMIRGSVLGHSPIFSSPRFGTLSLLGSGYFADFELPGSMREDDVQAGRRSFYDSYDHAGHGRSGRALVALTHTANSEKTHLRTSIYAARRRLALLDNYTGYLLDPIDGDRRQQLQNTWSLGANSTYRGHLTSSLDINVGVGVRSDYLDQSQTHVGQSEQPLSLDRSLVGWQHLVHGLIGLEYRHENNFRIAAGGRVDVAYVDTLDRVTNAPASSQALSAVSPRLTAEWSIDPLSRLFLAYGRGFRPPEARAFTIYQPQQTGIGEELYTGGAPAMTVADSAEVGVRVQANRYLGASLAGFGALIERESIFDHVSGINLELNSTRRLGGELQLHSNPVDWLLLMADVTVVDARFIRSGAPIPLAPWLTGGARAIITHPSGLRSGVRFLGLAPRHLPHNARGSALGFVDLTLGYTFGRVELDLEIENLFDVHLREGEYHYASDWRTSPSSQIPVVHYVAGPPFNARGSVSVQW